MGQLALIIAAVIPPPASEPPSACIPPLLELLLLDPPDEELLLLDPPDEELLLELLLLDPPPLDPPPASPLVDGLLLHPAKAPSPSKANVALKPKVWEGFIFFILFVRAREEQKDCASDTSWRGCRSIELTVFPGQTRQPALGANTLGPHIKAN